MIHSTAESEAAGRQDATPSVDPVEVRRHWRLLGDKAREVRAFGAGPVLLGVFDDGGIVAQIVAETAAEAIYVGLNPTTRPVTGCLAPGSGSGAADIAQRAWLLIDFDPVRPAKVPSTDAEHEAALQRSAACAAWLRGQGVPAESIVRVDSGNGGHVVVRIDLPNDRAAERCVKEMLAVTQARFSDAAVAVDQSVSDAPRITRLAGTVNAKGTNTAERPHRIARILDAPAAEDVVPCPREVLEHIAAGAPTSSSESPREHREPGWAERELAEAATPPGGGAQRAAALALAGWLAQEGRTEHEAIVLLWHWLARLKQDERNPWMEEHAREFVRWALEKEAQKPPSEPSFLTRLLPSGDHWRTAENIMSEQIDWLWPGRLARGKLTILDGDPGQGKSTLTIDLAARVSTGAAWPGSFAPGEGMADPMASDGRPPVAAGVVVVTYEDGPADTIRPRLEAAGADLARVVVFNLEHAPSIPDDLDQLEVAVRAVGAALVIFDPLMAGVTLKADSHSDHHMRRVLRPLAALAERLHLAILGVRHRPKAGGRNAITAGNGSIAIVGAARVGLLAAGDPEAPDDPHAHVLAVSKSNLAAHCPTLRYRTVGATVMASETGRPIPTSRIEWGGVSELTADAVVAREQQPVTKRDVCQEVIEQLRDILKDGPVPSKEVYARTGRTKDNSTLRKARSVLGVQITGTGAKSTWELPRTLETKLSAEAATGGEGRGC